MITEQDLREAIAECQGQRNPNANTCIKLAAFLTIQRELYGKEQEDEPNVMPTRAYSYLESPARSAEASVDYQSDTEFGQIINSKKPGSVFATMDELMSTLQVVYPKLYESVIRQLNE